MKVYEGIEIRNVGLVGHGHSGKTSLTAALLYTSGATNRLTKVDAGSPVTAYDEEEVARKITISTALATTECKQTTLKFFDTPGFQTVIHDTKVPLV